MHLSPAPDCTIPGRNIRLWEFYNSDNRYRNCLSGHLRFSNPFAGPESESVFSETFSMALKRCFRSRPSTPEKRLRCRKFYFQEYFDALNPGTIFFQLEAPITDRAKLVYFKDFEVSI